MHAWARRAGYKGNTIFNLKKEDLLLYVASPSGPGLYGLYIGQGLSTRVGARAGQSWWLFKYIVLIIILTLTLFFKQVISFLLRRYNGIGVNSIN